MKMDLEDWLDIIVSGAAFIGLVVVWTVLLILYGC
ncbi:hypothetical protein SAMN05444487_11849 [Marininema mesophilum]|uniref:Uncharacterized protein n=1 Tax=Marininema mesophilum TaxID=1048340 RepID=A0A1H3BVN5_9BACL|nr:hypothetical protein SAMN05444487_11849 [Marininema mesophilum]